MRLQGTPEMDKLWKKIEPYVKNGELIENAPEQAKKALEEYRRLSDEREKFILSL